MSKCMFEKIALFAFYIGLVVITLLSLLKLPTGTGTAITAGSKGYIGHGLAYCILTIVGWVAFSSPRGALVGFILVFGMCLEAMQLLISYRTFNPLDIASNGTGVLVGCGMAAIFNRLLVIDR